MRNLFMGLLAFTSWMTNAADIAMTPGQMQRMGVTVAPLSELQVQADIPLSGRVVIPPAATEIVTSPLSAIVSKVMVAEGERVSTGQLLARLQGPEVIALWREFRQARAQAQLAEENLRRDEALFAEGIIPGTRVSATRVAADQSRSLLAEKRALMTLMGMATDGNESISFAEIRSPLTGVVLAADASPGKQADAMTPLFVVARTDRLWLEMPSDLATAALIQNGDEVWLPACAKSGKVLLVAPHVQPGSQTVQVRADLSEASSCVRPQQFIGASIRRRTPQAGTLRIPVSALVRHDNAVWLFVASANGFSPVRASVIAESASAATVQIALPQDARIVISGASSVKAAWLGLGAGEE